MNSDWRKIYMQGLKVTEGPWEIYEVTDDTEVIARGIQQVNGRGINQGEEFELFHKADALLMAQAPSMYMHLDWIRKMAADGYAKSYSKVSIIENIAREGLAGTPWKVEK